jgi:hypothetical protein
VEYRTEQNQILFYSTLVDVTVRLPLPDGKAEEFAEGLIKGVENMQTWLRAYFPENSDDAYKILAHTKIIE